MPHRLEDPATLDALRDAFGRLRAEVGRVIIGQDEVVLMMMATLLSRGHALLVGVPGLAKTLLVRTLAQALDLSFNRIQFTPDLMPSDITGTEVMEEDHATGKRAFVFMKGPVFAQVVLADEINRTPPKTQAALLEAMQEHRVTAGGRTFDLEPPFFVLATQNPIEQEGTYPLPEAQLDRFMLSLYLDYPSLEEELAIVRATTTSEEKSAGPVLSGADLADFQAFVRALPVAEAVVQYAVRLARATRPGPDASETVRQYLAYGAGPRASQYLVLGAKALAALDGRLTPLADDVRRVAVPVLRHRIVTSFNADADGVSAADVVSRLLDEVRP
jgi:MoxR-like ATPase